MAYAKVNIDSVIEADPSLNVADMTEAAVRDHEAANGCVFAENAAARAVQEVGLCPDDMAISLREEDRVRLGQALEALEVECSASQHIPTDQPQRDQE